MFVHAYQSYLFNLILSERIGRGLPLDRPVEGDVVVPTDADGNPNHDEAVLVTARNIDLAERQMRLGRAFVTHVLYGMDGIMARGEPGEIEHSVIDATGVTEADFNIPELPHCASTGSRREILCPISEIGTTVDDGSYVLSFSLPKGNYATCLLREYMKSEMDDYRSDERLDDAGAHQTASAFPHYLFDGRAGRLTGRDPAETLGDVGRYRRSLGLPDVRHQLFGLVGILGLPRHECDLHRQVLERMGPAGGEDDVLRQVLETLESELPRDDLAELGDVLEILYRGIVDVGIGKIPRGGVVDPDLQHVRPPHDAFGAPLDAGRDIGGHVRRGRTDPVEVPPVGLGLRVQAHAVERGHDAEHIGFRGIVELQERAVLVPHGIRVVHGLVDRGEQRVGRGALLGGDLRGHDLDGLGLLVRQQEQVRQMAAGLRVELVDLHGLPVALYGILVQPQVLLALCDADIEERPLFVVPGPDHAEAFRIAGYRVGLVALARLDVAQELLQEP